MNLTIYAGTFNPIHNGHLAMAQCVKDELGLDKITFIPSFIPPHRENELAASEHRLKMLELAIKDNESFELDDIEFKSNETSYTCLTLQKLQKKHNLKEKINFIIGTDAFEKIDSWFEPEKIAKAVKFIILVREENFDSKKFLKNIKLKNFEYRFAKTPYLEISSSYIREKIKQGKSIKYLVPDCVEEYIIKNGLFLK